jgi:uncharacterized protein YqeY
VGPGRGVLSLRTKRDRRVSPFVGPITAFVRPAPRRILNQVPILDQVKGDLATAMKAKERERVAALRLVLSELQKAAKEGSDDEMAVLRRERKRRRDAAAAYRDAGRDDLAEAEEREAEIIEAYLPAELDDAQLDELIDKAIASTGASSPKDMGKVMGQVMGAVAGRADGKRVSARVKERLSA